MTDPNLRPLSFGEILDGAFTLYRRNFVRFVGTSLLLIVGVVVAVAFLASRGLAAASVMPGSRLPYVVVGVIGIAILGLTTTVWSTLTWQAARVYVRKPVSLADALDAAVSGAMTLLGAACIALTAVGAAGGAAVVTARVLQMIVDATGVPLLSGVGTVVGVLGIAAAVVLSASLFFGVLPAVMVEEMGPVEAVVRSVQLARGALPRIAGVLVVGMLIVTLPSLAVAALTGGIAQLTHPGPGQVTAVALGALVAQQLLSLIVSIVTAPFLPAVLVLLYYDRRVRSEALDVQIATHQLELARA